MAKILGHTPQKQWEKELKAKAKEGKRTRGQMTLTGGASASTRLSDFFGVVLLFFAFVFILRDKGSNGKML